MSFRLLLAQEGQAEPAAGGRSLRRHSHLRHGQDAVALCDRSEVHERADGLFRTTLSRGDAGEGVLRLPTILMPSGVAWQHHKRFNEPGSPPFLQAKYAFSLDLLHQGVVQGIVPWTAPLDPTDEDYQLLVDDYKTVSYSDVRNGTLFVSGTPRRIDRVEGARWFGSASSEWEAHALQHEAGEARRDRAEMPVTIRSTAPG